MRLLWLADVLRAAGLTVHEVAGWRTRGDESYGPVKGVIIHETRGSATSSDAGEINVLVNGRVGLSGPIAQLYLSRTGDWHVVASGTCHHVKTGWGGPFNGVGNDGLLGIEAQHGEAEDWARKPVQYQSYIRGVAAILRHTGWPPPVGHKEHQPGDKPDPEFSMATFRAQVAAAPTGGYSVTDSQLIANGERAATALVAGTPIIKFEHPWNEQSAAGYPNPLLAIRAEITALRSVVETLVEAVNAFSTGTGDGVPLDAAVVLAGVDTRLEALRVEMRDAVADLGEGGAAQVRADT